MMLIVRMVKRLRRRREIAAKRRHILVKFAKDDVSPVDPQFEWLRRLCPRRANFILVTQDELARFQRAPPAVRFLHAVAWIPRQVSAIDRRLRDGISKTGMLAF